jgi:hypothetical protein
MAACAALTATALLAALALSPAYAGADASGGALAPTTPAAGGGGSPSASLAGGSEYGVVTASIAQPRPRVSELGVPTTATAGRPPRVTLRVDEAGVGTLNVRVGVFDLSTRKPVIVVSMGWVHTGRTLVVAWPHGATLSPGRYHVDLSVRDHHSGTLGRSARSSGVASLTVSSPATAPPLVPVGATLAQEAGVPTPAQTVAAGAVFPIAGVHNFGGPENSFGAPRTGHVHQGQDILTPEGTPIVAPLAGTIITASYQASAAGYYAAEHTAFGLDFMFAHCKTGSLLVGTAQIIAAGQTLCEAGQTGDATTPHLHFEVWAGAWHGPAGRPIDPLPYLEAWERAAP